MVILQIGFVWQKARNTYLTSFTNPYSSQLLLLGKFEYVGGPIFKVVLECQKGVLNLFLSISMAYNVISCQKVAENTQILKIAKFAM